MVVLIDTNIILDFLLKSEPFVDEANAIYKFCSETENTGYITAHTITNIFYILRKRFSSVERKNMLSDICSLMEVAGIDKEQIINTLSDDNFDDIEDCLQAECAKTVGAEYIITRNTSDFMNSPIRAVLPNEFLREVRQVRQ
jgi:predicted nucleic acid-binding protein